MNPFRVDKTYRTVKKTNKKKHILHVTLVGQIHCAGINLPISNKWENVRTKTKSYPMGSVVRAHAAEKK